MDAKQKNEFIISAIIPLVEGYKDSKGDKDKEDALRYILGQTIRQYEVDQTHKHVSERAKDLWNTLTRDPDIFSYEYRDLVKVDNIVSTVVLPCFKGAKKYPEEKPQEISPNSTFVFKDVFHVDHMIPVSAIRDRLANLEMINHDTVKELLDEMHLCWILKEEDKKLGRTANREGGFDAIRDNLYKNAGITILANTYTV